MYNYLLRNLRRVGVVGFVLLLCVGTVHAEKEIPVTPSQASTSLLPYLEWMLDPTGALSIEEVAAPARQGSFRPLHLLSLPREAGTVWLRCVMAGRPAEVRPSTLLLDMGAGVPGTPTLYVPRQSITPAQRSVFLLPEARQDAQTVYIRLNGLPSVWFAPTLRTPYNAAIAWDRLAHPAAVLVLLVVMLLCVLRSMSERGQWRVWTSIYTGAAVCYAVLGVPTTAQGHVPLQQMVALLAPTVALMLLPHVARHLMRTRQYSRVIDAQYIVLILPGAAWALLPLVPGYAWITRFLDLWPLGVLLLLPTTIGAWLCGLPGARRFLLGCLLPPLGVAVAWLGMDSAIPAPILATLPLWGVALGALVVAGTAAPVEYAAEAVQAPLQRQPQHHIALKKPLVIDDPSLRIISQEELLHEKSMSGDMHTAQRSSLNETRLHSVPDSLRLDDDVTDIIDTGLPLPQPEETPMPKQEATPTVEDISPLPLPHIFTDAMQQRLREATQRLRAVQTGAEDTTEEEFQPGDHLDDHPDDLEALHTQLSLPTQPITHDKPETESLPDTESTPTPIPIPVPVSAPEPKPVPKPVPIPELKSAPVPEQKSMPSRTIIPEHLDMTSPRMPKPSWLASLFAGKRRAVLMEPLKISGGDTSYRQRETAAEWVGEPMPIPKKPVVDVAPPVPAVSPAPSLPQAQETVPASSNATAEPFVPLSITPPAHAGRVRPALFAQGNSLLDFVITQEPETLATDTPRSPAPTAPILADTISAAPALPEANIMSEINTTVDDTLTTLLHNLDMSIRETQQAFQQGDVQGVQTWAQRMTVEAERFGLRALGRMARCVVDAAQAQDKDALGNLLPELELFVERNRIALAGK